MANPPDSSTFVTTALADNTTGPRGTFGLRKFWKEKGMPTDISEPAPIDFWYGKLFHGRIDASGTVIYPSETNFKQLPSEGDVTFWAFDFMVDAFSDFQSHFIRAKQKRLISSEGAISQIEPKRAWVSIHDEYNTWMKMIYEHLVTFWFQQQQRNSKIKNFSDFMHEFMELVDESAATLPLTKSAFIISRAFTPLSSALIVEISEDDHSMDIIKERVWVEDPNFAFYRKAASLFGFLIDKNAPWRLVADINSPMMQKYMEPYGVDPGDLFEKYYYPAHLFDIETLKRYLVEMYNAYVISYPNAKIFRTKLKGAGGIRTVSKLLPRRPTTLAEVNSQFGSTFWLKTYYYIRLREMGAPRDPVEFNKNLKKILQQNKLFDFDRALSYTDDRIKRLFEVH